LPLRLFGGEPGPLPSEDFGGDGGAGEQIAELTGSHKVLPMNSGAEAVESAIKVVRKWGYEVKGVPDGQAEIIVCADILKIARSLGVGTSVVQRVVLETG
jgi:hypothetical protein